MFDVFIPLVINSLEMAAIYGIVVFGLVISFRIVGFADLTMESGFTTGAAICAVSLGAEIPPIICLFLGALGGALAGCGTALLHVQGGVNKLLSGIIMMSILYSINLRIMGRSNYSLLNVSDIFDGLVNRSHKITILIFISLLFFLLLLWFFNTRFGSFLRATGENPSVVTKHAKSTGFYIIAGLMLSNSLIAFAGALAAQNQGFADVGMGTGIIISTLAALIIGETLVPPRSIMRLLSAAMIGSFLYQLILSIGLRIGINPWDLKIATGGLLAVAVIVKRCIPSDKSNLNIGSDVL